MSPRAIYKQLDNVRQRTCNSKLCWASETSSVCKMNGKVAFLLLVIGCMAIQISATIGPKCLLPLEHGPCRANIKRYGYNPETHQCEEFSYGGCRGNENNYAKKEDCKQFCA